MINPKTARRYLLAHGILLLLLLLFPLYRTVTDRLSAITSSCMLHDFLFLYCPFCGGTRAAAALLRLDLAAALAANPLVTLLALAAIVLDLVALIRLLRGHTELIRLPAWLWIPLLVLFLAWGVLRNYLLIAHGYDPLGDLIGFWRPQG